MINPSREQFGGDPDYPLANIVQGAVKKKFIFKYYKSGIAPNGGRFSNINIVMDYYYPANPRTPAQQANRQKYADGILQWQGFDDMTKQFYNKKAKYKHYSGFNLFLHYYLLN